MAVRIRIVRSIAELRECHTGFAIDDLEEFPAATFGRSAFTFAVVDDEKFAREDVDRSAQTRLIVMIIV